MTVCAIYCRISRDKVGAGLGVERQETDARELATRLGLTVAGVYCDNDLSAYSGKPRPEYLRMLADIEAGRIGTVLAWHTDRLHRSPTELEAYIATCERHGVPTHTVKAGPLDLATPSGRLVARQLGAVARYEVEHAIERQQAAKQQAAVAGKWGGGRRPFGFEPDGVTVRESEARVIAEATDAILLGSSLRSQARLLNERGIGTTTGLAWRPDTLRNVLKRPRNAGLREHRGDILGKAEWPAVVAEEKWRAVRALLTDPARRTNGGAQPRWLLSGIARCGVCGEVVNVTLLESTRNSVPSYTCKAGKHVVRNAAELERHVCAAIVARLRRPDAIELLRPARPGVDLAGLRAEEAELQRRKDELAGNLELDERSLVLRAAALQKRIEEIQAARADAARGSVFAGVVDAPDVEKAWAGLDFDRRRTLIDALISITVLRTGKGRPKGWKPGQPYFRADSIDLVWRG
jgi:site-specific DNA recombinase